MVATNHKHRTNLRNNSHPLSLSLSLYQPMASTSVITHQTAAFHSYKGLPSTIWDSKLSPKIGFPVLLRSKGCGNPTVCSIVTSPRAPGASAGASTLIRSPPPAKTMVDETDSLEKKLVLNTGKFGKFGGKFVPETLVSSLSQLEDEFYLALLDPKFQAELAMALRDYVGRETPLYFAEHLTDHYKGKDGEGPEIYLKREDLNHGGAHKINNAIAQAMLARRMGLKRVVAATGAGAHGVATAAACSKLSLECTIFMGTTDMEKQVSNVILMKLLGAQVKSVNGSFKDATSEAIRGWVGSLETSYYLTGSAVGPHPYPMMVREFQSAIGKETRRQATERWGGKPDVLVACVGSGSNALGLFSEFIREEDVRLIGVEAAGLGLESGKHSATLARGEVGVYHGAMSFLLQDEEGQIIGPHSIAVGLKYPGVSPELSFYKDMGRVEIYTATDNDAIDAYQRLCRLEGIFPALEAAHALAFLEKLCPTLPSGSKVIVSCSGRGDKDDALTLRNAQLKMIWQLMSLWGTKARSWTSFASSGPPSLSHSTS